MERPENFKKADFLTNTVYLMSIAMDLMIRQSERYIKEEQPYNGWKQEKKKWFSNFTEYIRKASLMQDSIMQDIYGVEAKNNYKYVQVWQEEANELARLVLLLADRNSSADMMESLEKYISSIPGDGKCDDKLLSKFRLNKPKE